MLLYLSKFIVRELRNMREEGNKKLSSEIIISIIFAVLFIAAAFVFCFTYFKADKASEKTLLNNTVQFSTADLTGTAESDGVAVISDVKNSVVEIYASVTGGTSRGSGVITGSDSQYSYITTCHHVIDMATEIKVNLTSGETLSAELVGGDPVGDIAVIRVNKTGLTTAVFADSDDIYVGETVYVIGNPLGSLGGTVSKGIISALERQITISGIDEPMTLIQTDAAINEGNSGGAMFSEDGLLIGIVNAKSMGLGVEGIGFAIPSNTARNIATQLIESYDGENYGYVAGRYKLGGTLTDGYYSVSSGGIFGQVTRYPVVYISDIETNGSLYASGFRINDILVSVKVGGEFVDIQSAAQLKEILYADGVQVGTEFEFKVKENGNYNADASVKTLTLSQYIYGA